MIAFSRGDLEAFEEIVKRHQKPLVNFFYRLLWDMPAAEDCAQEVFVRLFSSGAQYSRDAKFTTFLYTVARNLWIDRLRMEHAQKRPVSLSAPTGEDKETMLSEHVANKETTASAKMSLVEQTDRIRRAIESLPEELRIVFILGETEGLKYTEIAEIISVPVGTVKSRMHTAVLKLRELLTEK
jgi:RNA polymerase sigma-70 factor (ECF subfamily)